MIFNSFKTLLGNGRAWRLIEKNINDFIKSLLKPVEEIRRQGYRIAFLPFIGSNKYSIESERMSDLENYENLFGISASSKTIEEREQNAIVQWALIGGQSWRYIRNVLIQAGFNPKVIENIPAQDLSLLGSVVYNEAQYNETFSDEIVQYGGSSYIQIGNGNLRYNDQFNDPVQINNWQDVLIIDILDPITYGQYETFIDLVLTTKPAQSVVLAKVTYY